jgi:hypothetical protein
MHLPELGAEGPATITAVAASPPIEPDDGTGRRLVTSVFRHAASNVVDVSTTGSDESIGATANHPFWSEDRQAFIPAGDLQPGERLLRADGHIDQVTSIIPRAGPEPVFNLEIDGQHVYFVGCNGLLVHNSYSDVIKMKSVRRKGRLGETLAGIPDSPKEAIDSITGTASRRFPDRDTATRVIEVKNRTSIRLTNQLRDYMEYAAREGKMFVLRTRKGAIIDPAIQEYADALGIVLRIVDGLK